MQTTQDTTVRHFSWQYIPIIFIIWLIVQLGIFVFVAHNLPELKEVGFPINFHQAQLLSKLLSNYLETHYFYLVLFQASFFLLSSLTKRWQFFDFFQSLQTWCIPGTFLFNLLGGALFGIKVALPLCLILNTLGAFLCFSISKHFMGELIQTKFQTQFLAIQNKINEHKSDLFFFMLSARVFPGSPNWAMNLSFPHLNIPSKHFIFSIFFGLIPWNFIACEAGVVISTFQSKDQIMKPQNYIILISLAVVMLIPPIVQKFRSKQNTEKQKSQ